MPITSATQVVAHEVAWLWPGYLAQGKLALLDGDPDLGKSFLALDLCARLSRGSAFPDGRPGGRPANALFLSAEDAPADTIVPRLQRLGADLDRVFVWQHQDGDDWPWRFPSHAARLDEALARTDARLAVIDPVMAFLDAGVLSGSDQSVRRAVAPLIHLAQKHRCTLLFLRHLSKQGGGRAVYRGLGSIGFVAACRFAMLVANDPLDPTRCVLAPVRNSLAELPPSLAYRLRATEGALPTVDWLGQSHLTADELLNGASYLCNAPRDQAALFLKQHLAGGARTSQELWAAAQKAGIAVRTLQRARKDLAIKCRRVQEDDRRVTYWLLPQHEVPRKSKLPAELERFFAEQAAQFPPPSPLDPDYQPDDDDPVWP